LLKNIDNTKLMSWLLSASIGTYSYVDNRSAENIVKYSKKHKVLIVSVLTKVKSAKKRINLLIFLYP